MLTAVDRYRAVMIIGSPATDRWAITFGTVMRGREECLSPPSRNLQTNCNKAVVLLVHNELP